jgi:hypothetical protein
MVALWPFLKPCFAHMDEQNRIFSKSWILTPNAEILRVPDCSAWDWSEGEDQNWFL